MVNSKFTRRTFIKGTGWMTVATVGRMHIPESLAASSSTENQAAEFLRHRGAKAQGACECVRLSHSHL